MTQEQENLLRDLQDMVNNHSKTINKMAKVINSMKSQIDAMELKSKTNSSFNDIFNTGTMFDKGNK